MSLLKKTVLLMNEGKPRGYVTVVRVGDEAGIKIVGDAFRPAMKIYVKIGKNAQKARLSGKRTELPLSFLPTQNDPVSCVVYTSSVVAKGGKDLPPKELDALLVAENEKSEETPANEKPAEKPAETAPIAERTEREREGTEAAETPAGETDERPVEDERTVPAEDPTEAEETTPEGAVGSEDGGTEREQERAVAADGGEESEDDGKKKELTEEEELLARLGKGTSGYYLGIRDKVDELFVVYPQERKLIDVIPDSDWVRIKYDGEDYYVVGKLFDGGKVRYLGYGVPGVETVRPPKVADGIANWFPVVGVEPYEGYWLFFQDAETGKIEQ